MHEDIACIQEKEILFELISGRKSEDPNSDDVLRAILVWAKHSPDRAAALAGLLRQVQWGCVSHMVFSAAADDELLRKQPESLHLILAVTLERPGGSHKEGATPDWQRFVRLKEEEAADMPDRACWLPCGEGFQPYLTSQMRGILVEWLYQLWCALARRAVPCGAVVWCPLVHESVVCASWRDSSLMFVTVRMLDHYVFCRPGIARNELQLVGAICLSVAMECAGCTPPFTAADIRHYTAEAYPLDKIVQQRAQDHGLLCQLAQTAVTPLPFLDIFAKCAPLRTDGCRDRGVPLLARYLLELGLLSTEMLSFPPSTQALSAFVLSLVALRSEESVHIAEKRLQGHLHRPRVTRRLKACMQQMHILYTRAVDPTESGDLAAIANAYLLRDGVGCNILIGGVSVPIPKIPSLDREFDELALRLRYGVVQE